MRTLSSLQNLIDSGRLKPPLATDQVALSKNDTLVLCAGFEDRTLAVLTAAVRCGARGFHAVVLKYLPELASNRLSEIRSALRACEAQVEEITYDRADPGGIGERVLAATGAERRLNIEVSGMSRLCIVQLVSAAIRSGRARELTVWYAMAENYPPTRAEFETQVALSPSTSIAFLSTGALAVTVVPELSSVAMFGEPLRAIVFPSWNPAQLAAVCAELQPAHLTAIHSMPTVTADEWRLEAVRTINHLDTYTSLDEIVTSSLNYDATLQAIAGLYVRHAMTNRLLVVPTGSKMQSLAVGVACGFLQDIQVVYPAPHKFSPPERYTQGVAGIFRVHISL